MRQSTAERLADTAGRALGGLLPLRLRAWDGSEYGPGGGPVLVVNSKRALRRLIWSPNENGLAEAYITGDIDVDGDLRAGLVAMWEAFEAGKVDKPSVSDVLRLAPSAIRLGAIGRRPPGVSDAAQLSGDKHSRTRDRAAIAHHYDLSNDFYEMLLDESMAYSCAYFVDGPNTDLAKAQRAKLDLICHKLGFADAPAGTKHLDIGCGWGSLICHAAEHYGTVSTGVTLSAEQHAYVTARVAEAGLQDRVTVRLADYRELLDGSYDGGFDAVSTIEMGEHVGDAEYPAFAGILHRVLRPGGRALVQQMSRGDYEPGGGSFIETYIAPDMHMKPLPVTLGLIAGAGLEIRDVHALREHYDWTVTAWERTLEQHWDEAVDLIGPVGARVWRLYLVGGGLAFAQGRMGVDQILAVRPLADGGSGMPPSREGWEGVNPTGPAFLLLPLGLSLAAVVVVMAVAFLIGRATGTYSIIDAIWGPGFVVATLTAFLATLGHGNPTLRLLLLAVVAIWGLRLGIYILIRNHGLPEDQRYQEMLKDAGPWAIVRKVQLPQGLTMWFVSLGAQVGMVYVQPVWALVWIGVAIWIVGFVFEAVGDGQLRSFKSDPANKGKVMDRGLWRYTRHPNYFGEATMWWGIFVMVCYEVEGLIGACGAALITWLLVAKTGKALTEKNMSKSKPGYAEYIARTSGFFPLPPKNVPPEKKAQVAA